MESAQHHKYERDQPEQAVEQLENDCHGNGVVTVGVGAESVSVGVEKASIYVVLKRQRQRHQTIQNDTRKG